VIEIPCPAAWPELPIAPEDASVAPAAACAALLEGDWPDPLDPALYGGLRRAAATYPDRALFQRLPGLHQQIASGIGWEVFLAAVAEDPDVVGALLERAVTLSATVAGEALRHGADALVMVEELPPGEVTGSTAEILERWVFPFDRLLLEGPSRAGAAIVAWCPGASGTLWERFIALGARLLGPLPLSGGTLSHFRARWPRRVGIYGARETGPILARGQAEAIRRHVADVAAAAGADAGLILAAPDLSPRTPMGGLESFIAAVRECRY
jgi:uroporphyrinogen-III decarboxylase